MRFLNQQEHQESCTRDRAYRLSTVSYTHLDVYKRQSVHWKLSARTDELMVKENSLPKACAVAIVADLRGIKTVSYTHLKAQSNSQCSQQGDNVTQ